MSNKITEKELQEAVDNCVWKRDFDGVDFCAGMLLPCIMTIEKGQCGTIKDLVSEKEEK